MRGYFARFRFLTWAISLVCLLWALDAGAEEQPLTYGGFQWGGSIEAGYRLTDVDGNKDRYKEVVDLWDGPRLFGLNLWVRDPSRSSLMDYFTLTASGLGDPYPFARLQVKKDKYYDVTGTYREYRFSFNREDTDLLTDNHDFHQIRRMGGLTLTAFPADDVRLNFGWSHAQRDGDARVPRPFIFSPSSLRQDLAERLDQFYVSGDFSVSGWDFHIKQAYWTFTSENEIDPRFGSFPTGERRLENVETYVTTAKAHTRLGERWDLNAGYTFAHSDGDAKIRTPGFLTVPGQGGFGYDTHIGETGLSFLLLSNLILHLDYQFHTRDQGGGANTDLTTSPAFDSNFALRAHTGTFQVEYIPLENLTLRAGYRFQYRDVNANFDVSDVPGGPHLPDSQMWTHGWIGSVDWKPFKSLSIFGEYQGADFSNPYTWISPEQQNIAKVRVKYKTPIDGLALRSSVSWNRKTNPDQEYRVDTQDYTAAATYQPSFLPGLMLDAAFTYERVLDKQDILSFDVFGLPLFTRFAFDSDAYIYTGTVAYEGIYKGLGARLTGSYAQTKGENAEVLADLALSMWYKNPYVTPIVTLERTYLVDHERKNDGFDANMVTFSLRKEF
jgi:hypothetical protein